MSSKNAKKIERRLSALVLSFMMCLTFMPSYAFAVDEPDAEAAGTVMTDLPEEDAVTTETPEADAVQDAQDAQDAQDPADVPEAAEKADDEKKPAADADKADKKEPAESKTLRTQSAGSVVVEATEDKIIIHINSVGSSGSAGVYRYTADSYHRSDPLKGVSKNQGSGVLIKNYTLGTAEDIEFDRYAEDGTDYLYDKYYVLQGNNIVAGPFYASEIESVDGRNATAFDVATKKGLTHEDNSTIATAEEFGVSNTVINWDLCSMIYKNEDANGKPIDNSNRNAIEFVSNGETFYFDADYIRGQDALIRAYTQNHINISLVIISWVQCLTNDFPLSLRYSTGNSDRQTMGFNTSNELGRKYWIAALEFMAERYSDKENMLVDQYIIGNEIDFTYDWYLIQPLKNSAGEYQKADFNTFMEEYARTLRLADLAVKKYNKGSKVLVSLTHNWAENNYEGYGWGSGDAVSTSARTIRVNSYAPKKIFDWLVKNEGDRGNFNWGLSVHPYPIVTTSSNPIATDKDPSLAGNLSAHSVSGNANTSPFITAVNLELYQIYLSRAANKCKGETRIVSITEGSICNLDKSKVTRAEYERSMMEQAASIAMMYYRAACVPCINRIAYFEYHDQNVEGNYQLGLAETDGTEKPAANVWRYIDTDQSFAFSGRFLKYIAPNAGSYKDLMNATGSGYDWNKYWTEDTLTPRDEELSPILNEDTERVYGSTRYETSVKTADAYKKQLDVDKFDAVILACGTNFADALAGSYLAGVRKAPILLVDSKQDHIALVQDYIKKNLKDGGTVYLLGGAAVVPDDAVKGLAGYEVKRLGGKDRYDTNVKILEEAAKYSDGEDVYLVASGAGFADSLSASATGKPIILVKGSVQDSQKAFINSLKGKRFYIIGGTGAVNANMEKVFANLGKTTRIGGATRYETSANVARTFFPNPSVAVLAYGLNFPDGLCGGPLAYSMGGPLLLVANGRTEAASAYLDSIGVFGGEILGGPALISDANARILFGLTADAVIK